MIATVVVVSTVVVRVVYIIKLIFCFIDHAHVISTNIATKSHVKVPFFVSTCHLIDF